MVASNEKLRAQRLAAPSPVVPGEPMSRAELAEAVNRYLWETTGVRYALDAHSIGRYEREAVRWPSAPYRSGLRAILHASDADLGFFPTRRGRASAASAADRVAVHGEVPFLATSIGSARGRISWAEVAQVRAMTTAIARSENLFGGGLSAAAAFAQLRWAKELLGAKASVEVRKATSEAVGNLAGVVAFCAFDVAQYAVASQCHRFALWCADQAGSWSLRANTLAEMGRVALRLGELDEALSLIEFAQVRADRLTPTARAMLWAVHAQVLARLGRLDEVRADVDRADAQFVNRCPELDPGWLRYYDTAEHRGSTGKALIPLASAMNRSAARVAVERLTSAVDLQDVAYPRSRAFSGARLAALVMVTGDPREAAAIGMRAVTDAAEVRSTRLFAQLAELGSVSARHSAIGEVAELGERLTALTGRRR